MARSLRRRYWAERRFQFYGMTAVFLGIVFVLFLFVTVFTKGASTFRQSYIEVEVFYDPALIDPAGTRKPEDIANADYQALVRAALKERFPRSGRAQGHARSHATHQQRRRVRSAQSRDEHRRAHRSARERSGCSRATTWTCCMKGHIAAQSVEGGKFTENQLRWIDDR